MSQPSSLDAPIDLQTALSLPRERVAAWSPQTVVWAPGGTRRHAIAAGVPLDNSYIDWAGAYTWPRPVHRCVLIPNK